MSGNVAWITIKTAARNFGRDNVMILSAALAFFSMLSLAPLLVLLLTITGWLGKDTQQRIVERAESLVGPQASEMLSTIIQQVEGQQNLASTAAIIGLIGTLIAATGAFTHLQYSLNRIFKVRLKKEKGFLFTWLWTRLLSLLMILGIAAVLIASVVVASAISMVFAQDGAVWQVVNLLVSLAVFALAFMVMFKVLPDVELSWGSALHGRGDYGGAVPGGAVWDQPVPGPGRGGVGVRGGRLAGGAAGVDVLFGGRGVRRGRADARVCELLRQAGYAGPVRRADGGGRSGRP